MAATWWCVASALVLAIGLQVSASDVVYDDRMAVPGEQHPLEEYDPSPQHEREQELDAPQLSCYDCTSYMSSCKREVRDLGGQIVSRTGCKSKCFLRVGEEQSGALYRGCMDDFMSTTALTQDYVGCRVQQWNGKKSLWCLCGDDLCNGKSLKALFYYGFGSPNKLQYMPDGKAYLVESVDDRFKAMTNKVHNYNDQYEEAPATTIPREETEVDEDVKFIAPAGYAPARADQPEQVAPEESLLEEFPKQVMEESEQYNLESYGETQPGRYEEYPYGFHDEPHLPYPGGFPAYPMSGSQQLPEGQFLMPHPGQFPAPGSAPVPPFYQEPQDVTPPEEAVEDEEPSEGDQQQHQQQEQEQLPENSNEYMNPEGRSAVLPPRQQVLPYAAFPAHGYYNYPPAYGYPYHYGSELEPLGYYPQEQEEMVEQEQAATEAPAQPAAESTEDDVEELDSELYCPAAGIFTFEEDCSKFVMCLIDHIHGKPRMYVMKCPASLVFDSAANTCMQPEMSIGCKRLPAPEPAATSAPEVHERPNRGYGDDFDRSGVRQVVDYGYGF